MTTPTEGPPAPEPAWQFYRGGCITNITEEDARHAFDGWQYRSDDRGMALLLIRQMWAEIDRLRARSPTTPPPGGEEKQDLK